MSTYTYTHTVYLYTHNVHYDVHIQHCPSLQFKVSSTFDEELPQYT